MTRSEKIIAFLEEHGYQAGSPPYPDWSSSHFTEKHLHGKAGLLIVRVHHNLNDLIEVFQISQFFCAGDDQSSWKKMPEMDFVLEWLGEMLENKSLSSHREPSPNA